jgi:hypothetical protein
VTDVNSTLPDDDALAAFANTALGSGRRRRRQQGGADESASAGSTSTPAGEGSATVPHPTAAPGSASDTATDEQPSADEQPTDDTATDEQPSADEQPTDDTATDEQPTAGTATAIEVRAVTVPMTRTPVPPGLQGGVIEVQVPDLGPTGARGTQCTVMLSEGVRDRFSNYQLQKKMQGLKEPSNALVVRRAFLHARRNGLFGAILAEAFHKANAVDEEDYDEDGLLGEVIGRRTVRGRVRGTGQQSFRPSEQELATYDAFSLAYGFPDRSAFMEGLLDRFLPQMPTSGRRR